MFLPFKESKPLSLKREFNGTEFNVKDIVEVITTLYSCLVEIQNYIPNGWYRVKLPNGGFHETQILGKRIKSNNN